MTCPLYFHVHDYDLSVIVGTYFPIVGTYVPILGTDFLFMGPIWVRAQGPFGARAHLGPGPFGSGPRAHLGPGPIWVRAHLGPGPALIWIRAHWGLGPFGSGPIWGLYGDRFAL